MKYYFVTIRFTRYRTNDILYHYSLHKEKDYADVVLSYKQWKDGDYHIVFCKELTKEEYEKLEGEV